MGGSMSRDFFDPYAINTPVLAVCGASLFFNSVQNGVLRISNVYTNFLLFILFGVSNGCYGTLQSPTWGARLGVVGAAIFTAGPPLKYMFTSRLFPRFAHYGIGSFYMTYHSLQWYKELYAFEDAGEDAEDERF